MTRGLGGGRDPATGGTPARTGAWRRLASLVLAGLWLSLFSLPLFSLPATAEPDPLEPNPFAAVEEEGDEAAEPEMVLPYGTAFAGDAEDGLLDLLRKASHLVRFENRPPATAAGLERRAEADIDRLQAVLRSEGFYAAAITTELDQSSDPAKVTVTVTTGNSTSGNRSTPTRG